MTTASEEITQEVTSWQGVEAGPGSRGEFAFRLGRKEIGHLHGDRVLHAGFPKAVWHELHAQGRIDYHPVFPGRPGFGARTIETEDDVRDAIELLRLNYDRAIARELSGLEASAPEPLPFDPALAIRAFLLRRDRGNVLIYSTPSVAFDDVSRQYLNHRHEAAFLSGAIAAPLFVHEADREQIDTLRGTFSRRHTLDDDLEVIPTPGHTPGATAYLWDNGKHRFLFSGDTIYLDDGEWVAAVLESSDRGAYIESLELLRGVEFDVLVPWASAGPAFYALTSPDDARRRIDAIIASVRR